ncbi:hypothetical protein ACXVRB_03070 [Limosilactobacillus ingluviei]
MTNTDFKIKMEAFCDGNSFVSLLDVATVLNIEPWRLLRAIEKFGLYHTTSFQITKYDATLLYAYTVGYQEDHDGSI